MPIPLIVIQALAYKQMVDIANKIEYPALVAIGVKRTLIITIKLYAT